MVTIRSLDPETAFESQLGEQTGPIAMIETILVPRELTEKFLAIWRDDAAYMKAQPGFIATQMHQGTADSQILVNVAIWESTEALRTAFSTPEFQAKADQYPDEIIGYPHIYEKIAVEEICVT